MGEKLGLHQVGHAQSGAGGLVAVGGADAAFGRADFGFAFALLALLVERAVIGQDEMRAVADEQVLPDLDPDFAQALDFAHERDRVDHDAIPDDAHFSRAQNAGGNEVQDVFVAALDDGVAGVISALAADDDVGVAGQDIDDLALAFIAPLRADQYRICHRFLRVKKTRREPSPEVRGHRARR